MKILIVSIYDGGYGGQSAAIMDENGNLSDMSSKLTEEDFKSFEREYYEHNIRQEILDSYDHIVVCNNGTIEKVK